MTLEEARDLKPGDRIHHGPANATVLLHEPTGEIIIQWDHGTVQQGRHRALWMFELGEAAR